MELYFIGPNRWPTLVSVWDHRSNQSWEWVQMMAEKNPHLIFFLTVSTTDLDQGGYFKHDQVRGSIK